MLRATHLSDQELWGVLQACVPTPNLSVKKSNAMLNAVLDYWARHDVKNKLPEWFEVM